MRHDVWLKREMAQWEREGIADAATLARIAARYETRRNGLSIGQIIFSTLGALLIGLGVIALLAHNWQSFGRPMRTFLSFLPLVLCAGGYLLGQLGRKPVGRGYHEALGIFWTCAVGASIALVAQTYHISGDPQRFVLVWGLLTLPVLYGTRALGSMVAYFVLMVVWTGMEQDAGGVGCFFWLLALPAVPLVVTEWRESGPVRRAWLGWTLGITLLTALGIALERCLPGLWIIIYSGLFAALFFFGLAREEEEESGSYLLRPGFLLGALGLWVLSFALTFDDCWEQAFRVSCYRNDMRYHAWAGWAHDVVLAVAAPLTAVALAVFARRRGKLPICGWAWGALPIMAVALAGAAAAMSEWDWEEPAAFAMLLFFAVCGLVTLIDGIRSSALAKINIGTVTILAAILRKFLSDDWSFVTKGVVFILCGIVFLVVNGICSRKLRQTGRAAHE